MRQLRNSLGSHHRGFAAVVLLSSLGLVACATGEDTSADGSGETNGPDGVNGEDGSGSQQLAVLAVSDFHGSLSSGRELACTAERLREEHPAHLLLTVGDDVGASEFESAVQEDQPTIDFYNALEIDAAALGNHEFDEGYEDVIDRLEPEMDHKMLAANVFMEGTDEHAVEPYTMLEVDGLSVAVIGAVTDETPELVNPEGVSDLEFRDPVESINTIIDDQLNEDPDVIIASIHDGSSLELEVGEVPEDEWSEELHQQLSEEVDAVLGGHTHNPYAYSSDNFSVVQPGANAANIGQIILDVDTESGEVSAADPELIPVEDTDPADCENEERYSAAAEVVEDAEDHAEKVGGDVLTTQDGDLTTAWSAEEAEYEDGLWGPAQELGGDFRAAQSSVGSLVADFHQDSEAWPEGTEPDIGLINAGGLRDDIRGDGDVTLRDAIDVVPFNNRLVSLELTGETLQQVLEQQWSDGDYQQLGVSSNFRYTFDSEAEEGERITSMMFEGELIDEDDILTVGVGEFLSEGGDGLTAFTDAEERTSTEVIDTEVWPEYLESQDSLSPDFGLRGVEVQDLSAGDELSPGETVEISVGSLHSLSLGAPEVTGVELTLIQDGTESVVDEADYHVDGNEGSAEFSFEVPDELVEGEAALRITAEEGGTTAEIPVNITE